jgi:hypothetical protein
MTKYVNQRKSGGWKGGVYHTDEDCRYLGESYREVQPNEVENKELPECEACKGTQNSHDGGDKSIYQLAKRIGEQGHE